ncbi:MAG: RtcB family protein [Nanoarchaeota archaeon]|nr:RtcB family protein [Nanoarchaeota archaeon]
MGYKEKLKKISEYVYELPKEGKMLVPGRIFASEELMKKIEEEAIKQVAHVAELPGILKYSLAMPDLHTGYGFGIGGVAALDFEKGGISPGGIGYDINCTHPEVTISMKHGTWLRIKDIEEKWNDVKLKFSNQRFDLKETNLNLFMKREEKGFLYKITSKTGHEIKVTGDHPIFTKGGMKEAKNLSLNDDIAIHSFEGIEYEEPSSEIILTREDFEKTLEKIGITSKGNAQKQVMNFIDKLNILPLRYNSKQLPYLIKLIGFILGDGVISVSKIKQASFYAKTEDLEEIKKDIEELGFATQNIFKRNRNHKIKTYYGTKEFSFEETSLHKKSAAFAAILISLGCPYGSKTHQEYGVPKWILKAPLWQKRLFLAAFFGAELSSPKTMNKYNFYEPQLNMNKAENLKENAIDFLNDIRHLLSEFEVKSSFPVEVNGYKYEGKRGNTVGLRLKMLNNPENLLNFFEKISYEYNKEKQKKACLAANYIRLKKKVVQERTVIRAEAREKHKQNVPMAQITSKLESEYAAQQFIRHSIWSDYGGVKVAFNFMSFDEYCQKYSLGNDGLAWGEIEEIKKLPYEGLVYDVTMNDENHNFIANSFIVSNCGVRLLSTNLDKKEIYPKIRGLLDSLLKHVPAGLGSSNIRISREELDKVLENGAEWAVKNNYGNRDDLEFCEENGNMKGADAKKVSNEAKNRGFKQLATLGSGNHFLEIQYVDEIFDEKVAKTFGITKKGQVMVMIHCGSRGLGHQVCSDYLREMERQLPEIVAKLPDRELIYAPANHKLCKDYFSAMTAAANFAWCNRHIIGHQTRQAFSEIFPKSKLETVYDVAHNISKIEEHEVDGKMRRVYMHRKGATRAFGPGRKEIPKEYRKVGQPIILPGSMGTASYLLVGTQKAEEISFASTAHGAGREMSRHEALRKYTGEGIKKDLESRNIFIKSASWKGIAEEAPGAYKDIEEVAEVSHQLGIGNKVARLKPIGVIKG